MDFWGSIESEEFTSTFLTMCPYVRAAAGRLHELYISGNASPFISWNGLMNHRV